MKEGIDLNYIFIDSRDNIDYIGLVEEGDLKRFYIEEREQKGSIGNIYRGRVSNVIDGINAAFIDIGLEKDGYLSIKDALPREFMYQEGKHFIRDYLKKGDEILVQLIKDGDENKGPKLTRHLSLAGEYIVLTPYSDKISVSKKLDKFKREKLLNIYKKSKKGDLGFILRTKGQDIEPSFVLEEYRSLIKLFNRLEDQINFLPTPKLIYKSKDLIQKLLYKYSNEDFKLITNNKDYENYIRDNLVGENLTINYDKDFKIDYEREIMTSLKRALSKKLWLDSGAHIIIEELEAMTVIDVNSGKYTGGRNFNETIDQVNREAMKEIINQIILRDISGIILIDTIDYRDKNLREIFLKDLKKELEKYPDIKLVGISNLGFIEMTRRKIRDQDLRHFKRRCDKCNNLYNLLTFEK